MSGSSPACTEATAPAGTPVPTWHSDLDDVQLVGLDFDLPDPTQIS